MEGYVEGKSSYVEEKGLPPCALGYASIDIEIVHVRNTKEQYKKLEMTPTIITQ